MLQGYAAWVESEIHMVAEQTEKGYGEVGEAHWTPGEVGGAVEAVEDAPKLSIGEALVMHLSSCGSFIHSQHLPGLCILICLHTLCRPVSAC